PGTLQAGSATVRARALRGGIRTGTHRDGRRPPRLRHGPGRRSGHAHRVAPPRRGAGRALRGTAPDSRRRDPRPDRAPRRIGDAVSVTTATLERPRRRVLI